MISFRQAVFNQVKCRCSIPVSSSLRQMKLGVIAHQSVRQKQTKKVPPPSLFQPVTPKEDDKNEEAIGEELSGKLDKSVLIVTLNTFSKNQIVKKLALQNGLNNELVQKVLIDFRNYCLTAKSLPTDLHIILNDIQHGAGNINDIFPYFLRHAKRMYPHIDCIDDLTKISDLRFPPNWYPAARAANRRIIFHAGPTNSGKTYHALNRFMSAKNGVYCGPLKLLAVEVFNKCNAMGTPCDLVTGEEKKYAINELNPANHTACSVEMVNLNGVYEVAVIDEIQLLKDPSRGWAWTRAFLGLVADEIHLCGESAAIPIVKSICSTINEEVVIKEYERLTKLEIQDIPLTNLSNVQPGDCIVCFNKSDIFRVSQTIEKMGKQVAVIYGSLPPGTKLAQAARFNDPNDECKILVATDAIGMGLNLHIRRIIFYSICKPFLNEKGQKEMDTISVSSALQIAGRAGRFNTKWDTGYVTTFKPEDLTILKGILQQSPSPIEKVGLHPTADQIELYAYFLPETPLSNLINIFVALSKVDDSLYFICNLEDFKFLAGMIEHIPLSLRMKYVFCCAPINRKSAFVCNMFLKYARECSKNMKITSSWIYEQVNWPQSPPETIQDLVYLENLFDILDIYLWFTYRFPDLFPDEHTVRKMQLKLDSLIAKGIMQVKFLLQETAARRDYEYVDNDKDISEEVTKGTLTEKLLSEGHLTLKDIRKLKKEWFSEESKQQNVKSSKRRSTFRKFK